MPQQGQIYPENGSIRRTIVDSVISPFTDRPDREASVTAAAQILTAFG